MTDTTNILCMSCGEASYLTDEQVETLSACPNCGDTGTPAELDDTVTVTLTTHELRVLTFWADGYAKLARQNGWDPEGRMPKVLKVIRDRLGMQTDAPLSLSQELADLRQHLSEEHGGDVDFVLFDSTGCVECGAPMENPIDIYLHHCNQEILDERTAEDDTDNPPASA